MFMIRENARQQSYFNSSSRGSGSTDFYEMIYLRRYENAVMWTTTIKTFYKYISGDWTTTMAMTTSWNIWWEEENGERVKTLNAR